MKGLERVVGVGVHEGPLSEILLETIGPRELHLVDPWAWSRQWFVNHDESTQDRLERGEVTDEGEETYRAVCEKFAGDGRVRIHRTGSVEASGLFEDGSLDLVFIDGDHRYEAVADDLDHRWPKLRPGGVICGDDLDVRDSREQTERNGVARAVFEFIVQHEVSMELHLLKSVWESGQVDRVNHMFAVRKPGA